MARSLREAIDVCSTTGGFSTDVDCAGFVKAKIHRAGTAADNTDYIIDIMPIEQNGSIYNFEIPVSFYGFPKGYYDADIYDGDLFKRRVRLNLNTSSMNGYTKPIKTECNGTRIVTPNTSAVIECTATDCCAPVTLTSCETTTTQTTLCNLHLYSGTQTTTTAALAAETERKAQLLAFKNFVQSPVEVDLTLEKEDTTTVADMLNEQYIREGAM